jgi:hypothetical protein
MKRRHFNCAVMFLAFALGVSWAQDSSQQPATDTQQPGAAPAPAFGQDNTQSSVSDNPPISGLDQPSLEPLFSGRSYFIPGAHVSESVDSNVANSTGSSSINGVTRVLGSLILQRMWRSYDLSMDYVGGGTFYSRGGGGTNQVHTFAADQRILWRTGQLTLRDSFSYLPEGSFGYGSYGGSGALGGVGGIGTGISGGGLGGTQLGFFGPGQFAALGQQPRIANVALADITESFSPRSSVTVAGSYGLVHFINNASGFINSRQTSAQVGYNYQLNRKDQLALVYGFQAFRYPSSVGSAFNTHMVNLMYGHRISGRMDLVLGIGPQLTDINNPLLGSSQRLTLSGRASLRYRFPTTSVSLQYDHYNSSGSGFFTGAASDVARLSASRPFGRLWNASADIGFTHNSRILASTLGISAQAYNYLYAGGAVHRQLGPHFSASFSYQFNNLMFDQTFCGTSTSCSRTSQRHVATIGLDWHPRPIRLD